MGYVNNNRININTEDATLAEVNALLEDIEEVLGYPIGRATNLDEPCFIAFTGEEMTFLRLSGKMEKIDKLIDHYIFDAAMTATYKAMAEEITKEIDKELLNSLMEHAKEINQSESDSDIDESNSSVSSGK